MINVTNQATKRVEVWRERLLNALQTNVEDNQGNPKKPEMIKNNDMIQLFHWSTGALLTTNDVASLLVSYLYNLYIYIYIINIHIHI